MKQVLGNPNSWFKVPKFKVERLRQEEKEEKEEEEEACTNTNCLWEKFFLVSITNTLNKLNKKHRLKTLNKL